MPENIEIHKINATSRNHKVIVIRKIIGPLILCHSEVIKCDILPVTVCSKYLYKQCMLTAKIAQLHVNYKLNFRH
jgi:hypothetical protein